MLRRPLGETGLAASRIGLGLAALGRPVYIDVGRECDLGKERTRTTMEARCREVLDAAYAAGIRYLDVARSYGDAEAFLGAWLEVRDPPDVLVGSKWGYTYVGGWRVDADVQEVKDLSVDALRRQIAESRRLLGDRLSLYQIHSATIESGVFDDHEVLEELRSLRESGLFLGFSTSGPKQAEAIARGIQERVDVERLGALGRSRVGRGSCPRARRPDQRGDGERAAGGARGPARPHRRPARDDSG